MFYDPAGFLAQVDFFTPMVFRISAAAELVASALADAPQTASPSCDCHPLGDRRIPSLLKLHWLKSTFARKSASVIIKI